MSELKDADAIRRLLSKGFSDKAIAKKLRIEPVLIANLKRKDGITRAQLSQNRINTWIELIKSGVSTVDIAREYEVTISALRTCMCTAGISILDLKKTSQKNLCTHDKESIIKGFSLGFYDAEIARTLKISANQVRKYRLAMGIASQKISENRIQSWDRLLRKGYSTAEIADLYQISVRTLRERFYLQNKSIREIKKTYKPKRVKRNERKPYDFL